MAPNNSGAFNLHLLCRERAKAAAPPATRQVENIAIRMTLVLQKDREAAEAVFSSALVFSFKVAVSDSAINNGTTLRTDG